VSHFKNKDLGSATTTFIYGSQNTHQYNVKSIGYMFIFINNFQV